METELHTVENELFPVKGTLEFIKSLVENPKTIIQIVENEERLTLLDQQLTNAGLAIKKAISIVSSIRSNYKKNDFESNGDIFVNMQHYIHLEILSGISHSIKNNLFNAEGILRNLHRKLDNPDEKKDIERLLGLIQQSFLSVNQQREIQTGQLSISKEEFEVCTLSEIIRNAVNLLKLRIQREDISINIDDKCNAKASVDRNVLTYAFVNLFINSIEAFKQMPIRNRKVDVKIYEKGNDVVVMLSDNGIGLLKYENPEKIFSHGVTTKKQVAGYGLTYCRHAFQTLHKGSINIINIRNGLGFEIIIPNNL